MINQPDMRYDTSQLGGTFYDSYTNAGSPIGSHKVLRAGVFLDGGWAGDQVVPISNTTVNDNEYDFDTGGGGGSVHPHV